MFALISGWFEHDQIIGRNLLIGHEMIYGLKRYRAERDDVYIFHALEGMAGVCLSKSRSKTWEI